MANAVLYRGAIGPRTSDHRPFTSMQRQPIHTAIVTLTFALASPFVHGGNITLSDNNRANIINGTTYEEGYVSSWYKGATNPGSPFYEYGSASEYEEVEPGMTTGKNWDLVAFVTPADGVLGLLSSFNLKDGEDGNMLGDIFVSLQPPPTWLADPNTPYGQYTLNSFGYNFAIRLNFSTNTYTVTKLDANTVLENGGYYNGEYINAASQPWRVATTTNGISDGNLGTNVLWSGGSMTYTDTLSDAAASSLAEYPVTGASNYATIQVSWLAAFMNPNYPLALFHVTMANGDDNLIGLYTGACGFCRGSDESFTSALIGMGLLAVAGIRRWQRRKS